METQAVESAKVNKRGRLVHFEIMRIAAVYAVIFNHTGEDGFLLFSKMPPGSAQFMVYLFFSVFCKFAVPLFLAISGALMLNKADAPPGREWYGKILKFSVILIVYSLLYYFLELVRSGGAFEIRSFLKDLYTANIKTHLWYLYLFIAYLAVLPFLRSLVKNLENKYFFYMVAIVLLYKGFLPCMEYFLWQGKTTLNSYFKITWLTDYAVLYPCLGFFMQHRITKDAIKKHIGWVWLANLAGLAASCFMVYYKVSMEPGTKGLQSFHNCFVVINCVAVYLLFRLLFEDRQLSESAKTVIFSIGKCTFGIYLWHLAVKERPFITGLLNALKGTGRNRMACIWIVCLVILAISYVITLVQSKIPVLKKLVGF